MRLIKRNNDYFPTLFEDMFERDWLTNRSQPNTLPAVNIKENEDQFLVEMAAPGMDKNNFNIQLEKDVLTISYEQKEENEKKEEEFTRQEYSYKSFSRSFTLPDITDVEKISARYKDGILLLIIPKKEEAKFKAPKTIKIN